MKIEDLVDVKLNNMENEEPLFGNDSPKVIRDNHPRIIDVFSKEATELNDIEIMKEEVLFDGPEWIEQNLFIDPQYVLDNNLIIVQETSIGVYVRVSSKIDVDDENNITIKGQTGLTDEKWKEYVDKNIIKDHLCQPMFSVKDDNTQISSIIWLYK